MIYENRGHNIVEAVLWTQGIEQSEDPEWLVLSSHSYPGSPCFACLDMAGNVKAISLEEGFELFDCAGEELKKNNLMPA